MQEVKTTAVSIPGLGRKRINWSEIAKALAVVALCTLIAWPISHFVHAGTLIFVYLIGIIIVSYRWSRTAALIACVCSVFIYDYVYVPPPFQFVPNDAEDVYTLPGMMIIAVLISTMATMLRQSATESAERERTERAVSQLNRAMAATRVLASVLDAGVAQVQSSLGRKASLVLCAPESQQLQQQSLSKKIDVETASRALDTRTIVVDKENTSMFLPLLSGSRALGVMIVSRGDQEWTRENIATLRAITEQLGLGIERAVGLETAEKAKMQVEGVKLRNALLSSVSHDLRTPLASIMGAASSILSDPTLDLPPQHRELLQSIQSESDRLARFLKNLLDMTRIESGAIRLKKEWQSIEESVGVALNRLSAQLEPYKIVTKLPDDLPLVLYDEQLIDQVFFNLLDNAAKYATRGTEISIWAKQQADGIVVGVSNDGCTIPPGAESKMFDKFYRGDANLSSYGAGLGLTICRGIMQAHGGQIWAERSGNDGISMCFLLPQEGEPPKIELDEETGQHELKMPDTVEN